MMLRDLFNQIESETFSDMIKRYGVHHFIPRIALDSTVRCILRILNDIDSSLPVYIRVEELLSREFDTQRLHNHPHDVAIGVYFFLLDLKSPDHARRLARNILDKYIRLESFLYAKHVIYVILRPNYLPLSAYEI